MREGATAMNNIEKHCCAAASILLSCLLLNPAAGQPPAGPQLNQEAFRQAFQQAFEQAFAQNRADIETRERVNELIRAYRISTLEAIDERQFNDRWQLEDTIERRPAGEVLKKLIEPLQWQLDASQLPPAKLNRPITIDLTGRSRLEAFEQVCNELEVTARYPRAIDEMWSGIGRSPLLAGLASGLLAATDQPAAAAAAAEAADDATLDDRPTVVLRPGARELPVVFAGPFTIEVSRITEWAPQATGSIELSAYAHDFSDSVMAVRQSEFDAARISAIVDQNENDLRWENSMSAVGQFPIVTLETRLCKLLNDVKTITLKGVSKIKIPVQVDELTLSVVKEGATATLGGGSVEITAVREGDDFAFEDKSDVRRIELSYKNLQASAALVAAEDADGKLLVVNERSRMYIGHSGQTVLVVDGIPARLIVKIPQTKTLEYPFALDEIPLAKFEQQPRELSPIRFPGHASPVALSVDQLRDDGVFRKVLASVANHANKDIDSLKLELQYRNDKGELIKTHATRHGVGNPEQPFLASGDHDTVELTAFFMPEEASQVTLKLTEVVFTDATSWQPETASK